MGILGDQISNLAVSLAKCDASLQSQITGGGGGAGVYESTAPRAVVEADNGKWLAPSASGTFTLPAAASLPNPFEFHVYYPVGVAGTVVVDPNIADHFDKTGGSSGVAGQAIQATTPRALLLVRRGPANTWIAQDPAGQWALEPVETALAIEDLASGVPNKGLLVNLGGAGPGGPFDFTCFPVNGDGTVGGPSMGTVDEAGVYVDGGTNPAGVEPVMFEWVNGAAPITMVPEGPTETNIVVRPSNPGAWNVGPPSGIWKFQTPFFVSAGETVSFYFNNDTSTPRIYLRSSESSVPIPRSFADAVAAGPI